MKQQTKRDLQATALVAGLFAGGTVLSYLALRPSLQMVNEMTITKLNLVEAYMVIERMADLAPEVVEQAANDVHAQIRAGLEAAAAEVSA